MTIEDDIAFLERVPILSRLGAPALRILAIGAEAIRLESGQILFTAGEAADAAYVVQQGLIGLQPDRPGGTEVLARPGTLLGEAALLAETRRPATATAREDSILLRISRAMFLRMLDGYPDAAQRLRELIAARIDQWEREMTNIRAVLGSGAKPQ